MKIERIKPRVPLLHLSFKPHLNTLVPSMPANATKKKNYGLEYGGGLARVSLAPTIEKCLLGLQVSDYDVLNEDQTGLRDPRLELYLYETKGSFEGVTNKTLQNERLVYDARVTGESWALEEIDVKFIGTVLPTDKVTFSIPFLPLRGTDLEEITNEDGLIVSYVKEFDFVPRSLTAVDM